MGQIKYGVPQGSILGPLLFLIYINVIIKIPQTPHIIFYSDDTNALFSGTSLQVLEHKTNAWLEHLSSWLRVNKIQLNATKTRYIIFQPRNKCIPQEILKIKRVQIRQTWHHCINSIGECAFHNAGDCTSRANVTLGSWPGS